jgi:hypothetical protein
VHRVAYSRSAVICVAHGWRISTSPRRYAGRMATLCAQQLYMAGHRYLEDGHVHMAACALWQRLQLDGKVTCKLSYWLYL